MKNKLINIKNILRIIISVMVIISMSKSCAKAAQINSAMLNDITEKTNKVFEYYGYTYRNKFTTDIGYNTAIPKMCIGITTSDSPVKPNYMYVFYPSNEPMILDGNNYATWFYQIINLSNGNREAPSGRSINKNIKWKYIYTEFNWSSTTGYDFEANTEYGATILLQPPITYLQYNTEITDNTHNGSLFTYYFQGNLYGQSEIKLGDITINDSYYYEVRLRNSNTNVVIGTIFYDVNTNNTYNDGVIYQDNNKNIYVTTRLLNYSTQYQLEVESYYGDGGTNLYEDIDWYIFLPSNAVISGDSIQDFGNGEFSTQDSTNAIIDSFNNTIESGNKEVINNINDSSEVESIMSETFSGDIETISSDLGFTALDNPFTSFLFFVIDGVYDVMTEREDLTLNTHYKSIQFNLASTDFITPQSELKTFIRNMLICVYIYGNYKWFHYMITLLETARINKFMAEIGTDEFYDTDIM